MAAQRGCPEGQLRCSDFPPSLPLQDPAAGSPELRGQRWPWAPSWGPGQPGCIAARVSKRASVRAPPKAPAKNAGQQEELRGVGEEGRRGSLSPAQTGPASPTAALLSLGAARGERRRGLARFLGSNSLRSRKTRGAPRSGEDMRSWKHMPVPPPRLLNPGAGGNKWSPQTSLVSFVTPKSF